MNQIDASVYAAIDKVRQRPDVNMPLIYQPQTQAELRSTVRNDRMVESAFEGERFFDIRRWGIALDVFNVPIAGLTYVDNGQLITLFMPD